MEIPDYLRSLDQKLPTYQPSERTVAMVGGLTLILALGLDKSNFIRDKVSAKPVPIRSTKVEEPTGIYLPTTVQEVSDDLDLGNYVTTNVDTEGVFTGTRIDDYPTQGVAVVPSSLEVIEAFKKLNLKNTKPIVFISSSVQPIVDSVRRKSASPEAARQQMNRLVDSLRVGMNMPKADVDFVVFDEPHFAEEDLRDAISGVKQSDHYVERAKSLCRIAINSLSR